MLDSLVLWKSESTSDCINNMKTDKFKGAL